MIYILFFILVTLIFIVILHDAGGFKFEHQKRHFIHVIIAEYFFFVAMFIVFIVFYMYMKLKLEFGV